MPKRGRVAAVVMLGGMLALGGCGGGGGGRATGSVSDTAEAVRLLRAPDNPYRIIYYHAVDLTKRPDTTKAAPPPPPRTPAAPRKTTG